jgi:CelD/BcsL family acetyltransferase involved in cellulose biosynthesis
VSAEAAVIALAALSESDLRAWRALADAALEPNPFFHPDFVLPTAAALGHDVSLLVSRRDGNWRACLPVTERRGWRAIPARGLVTWRHQYCFLGTPLVTGEDPAAALREILELGLERTRGFLGLDLVSAEGPFDDALQESLEGLPRPVSIRRFSRAFIDRDGEIGTNLSSRHQKEFRRMRRRLGEELGAEVEMSDASGERGAIGRFLELEQSSWKGSKGTALLAAGHGELFEQVCRGFRERGALELLDLHCGERSVSMLCNLIAGDCAFSFKIAMDEDLRRWGPGTMLMLDQISRVESGATARRMDSCAEPSNQMINRAWSGRRELAILALPASGPRGALARAVIRGVLAARRVARR